MVGNRQLVRAVLYIVVISAILGKATSLSEVSSGNLDVFSDTAIEELHHPLKRHSLEFFDSKERKEFIPASSVRSQEAYSVRGEPVSEALDSWLQRAMEKKGTEGLAEISGEVLELARSIATSSNYQVEVNLQVVMEGGRTTIQENLTTLVPEGHKKCWRQNLRAVTFFVSAILVVGCVAALVIVRQEKQKSVGWQESQEGVPSSAVSVDINQACWHSKCRTPCDRFTPFPPKSSIY